LQVYVEPEDVPSKGQVLKELDCEIEFADTVWLPLEILDFPDDGSDVQVRRLQKFFDDLKSEEFVTGVYSNTPFS